MADEPNNTEEEAVETAPEETPVDETTAADAPAQDTAAAEAEPAAPAEPEVVLSPKERRSAKRAKAAAKRPAGTPKTPEERQAGRDAKRKALAAERRRYRARSKAKRQAATAERPVEELHAPEHGPGRPKLRTGVVVSDKADKTITVRIDVARRHRRYQKIMRSSATLHAHDERNDAHTGDTVRVIECRPMSRTKRWRLDEVLERAK